MVSSPARRQQVAFATGRGMSKRRSRALLKVSRSALRYGYRRIQVFLERQGFRMSADRAWLRWRKSGLQVPKKRPRRRIAAAHPRLNTGFGKRIRVARAGR